MSQLIELNSDGPEATARLAQALAPVLRAGDVLLLEGPVGAGKSHFARNVILTLLDVPEDVPSPTFTLVQTYETRAGEVWHADLYRLSDVDQVDELGLDLAFDTSICLIEWPDRLGPYRPDGAVTVKITPMADFSQRVIRVEGNSSWTARLAEVWP